MMKLQGKRLQDNENFLFLQRLLKNPRSLGAIVPSSKTLARFICRHIEYNEGDYIIEIGAGTGRFTRAILQAGIPDSHLIVLELDKELARYLRINFPDVHVIEGNAGELDKLIPRAAVGKVRTIISGLPMVNFTKKVQKEIIDSCFQVLSEGGGILQFTYGPISPISSKVFGLFARKLGRVFQNIPPATVWHYSLVPITDMTLIRHKRNYIRRLFLKIKKPLKLQIRREKF